MRVLGLCPITENMPSGTAIKPGDVLRIRNGKTVEVLNTDAEGRLVLADALSLAVEAEVDAIIDLATLTGAVSTALGRGIAGLMGSDDAWTAQVCEAARRAGEQVWPLPLPDEYRRDIESDVADIRNTGGSNPAGTLTAGLFLKEFTGGLPWAHLDIAGTARAEGDDGYTVRGGTGFGVRTLVELAINGRVALRPGAARRARWRGHTPAAELVASARAASGNGAFAGEGAARRSAPVSAGGVGTVAAVILAAVFSWAAVAKGARRRDTVAAFTGLGIPAPAVLAVAVPVAELAIAVLLVVRPQIGGALALAMLAAFTLAIVGALRRGVDTGCGCFGSRRDAPVNPSDVVRNALLAAFAVLATGARRLVAPSAGDVLAGLAAVVVAGAVLGVAQRRLIRSA